MTHPFPECYPVNQRARVHGEIPTLIDVAGAGAAQDLAVFFITVHPNHLFRKMQTSARDQRHGMEMSWAAVPFTVSPPPFSRMRAFHPRWLNSLATLPPPGPEPTLLLQRKQHNFTRIYLFNLFCYVIKVTL